MNETWREDEIGDLGNDFDSPDIVAAFTLLRLINRDDSAGAYQLVSRWAPDELAAALVQAHLGSLRAEVVRELNTQGGSAEVIERVDQMLCEHMQCSLGQPAELG